MEPICTESTFLKSIILTLFRELIFYAQDWMKQQYMKMERINTIFWEVTWTNHQEQA